MWEKDFDLLFWFAWLCWHFRRRKLLRARPPPPRRGVRGWFFGVLQLIRPEWFFSEIDLFKCPSGLFLSVALGHRPRVRWQRIKMYPLGGIWLLHYIIFPWKWFHSKFFFFNGKNAQELMWNHEAGIPDWGPDLNSKDHRTYWCVWIFRPRARGLATHFLD